MDDHCTSRRRMLKLGCTAIAAIPLMSLTGNAVAGTNASMRKAFNYQEVSKTAGKNCANCAQFIPGASASAAGACKVIPGDSEIQPTGYCDAYIVKK
ncbi:high-potential iron-sulfur protein [Rhodocyclus gracilis]|uniref:High-potential iron-sulfur protein n=1 Tax=Rhodocyclus tenuis TaxID=1066 RepID=A0A6L5JUF0_RHOTE|nr:high-potential iron-sulfur protein [Rhodocyclus gracilis]MQY50452.1 hypothetical protein [Rhodocyclus gracilis]